MPDSFMTLPYELREQIIKPLVRTRGTIELQYPLWADQSAFIPPIMQVCKTLRAEAIQVFYRVNVFMWLIDPEAVSRSSASIDPADPAAYPLQPGPDVPKGYGPFGPLISSLPWQYPNMLENLRNLRLNLYLPAQHDTNLWTGKFTQQLSDFVQAVDQGGRLKDFKLLIGTWHKVLEFRAPQLAAFDVLDQMQVRGTVQVRTRSLDTKGKAAVQALDLERRLRANASSEGQVERVDDSRPGGRHLDWEWEGGATV